MTAQNDKERLLNILHAHGQQFLSAFGIEAATSKQETNDSDGSEPEEEWIGFGSPTNRDTSKTTSDGECDDGSEQEVDDFVASSSSNSGVTVFLETGRKRPETSLSAKEHRKSFMSSKVSNITLSHMQPAPKAKMLEGESDDERTNAQNDALLHRLVHTKLLSGSLNPELNLNHAQRGRALVGRVLELAGEVKLGKGESVYRQEQRNKAAKHVREGLVRKQREQERKTLEEAKNLGNYHPSLKRLYDSNSSSTTKKRRTRGLGMGIGKFRGGMLKLSREEIASVTGSRKQFRVNGRQEKRQRAR